MHLFQKHGYSETTVADICAAADIARATFFLHFPTKSALLLDWSRTMAAEWTDRRLRSPKMTPSETLRQLLEFIVPVQSRQRSRCPFSTSSGRISAETTRNSTRR
ncbi:MAG: TetR/AcrR family transcriptional regulator, partial [Gammaproteobacteria bacterium]